MDADGAVALWWFYLYSCAMGTSALIFSPIILQGIYSPETCRNGQPEPLLQFEPIELANSGKTRLELER